MVVRGLIEVVVGGVAGQELGGCDHVCVGMSHGIFWVAWVKMPSVCSLVLGKWW